MAQIQFFFLEPISFLKDRNRLKSFLIKTAGTTRKIKSLNIIFCSDEYLLSINRQFLDHDYYTDIITFDLSPSKKSPIEAELYISVDRVKDNASLVGDPYYKELHRVVFHGLLHLMGHGDKTKKDKETMRQLEDKLIGKYFAC
jgi:probable rRNA maturation factor